MADTQLGHPTQGTITVPAGETRNVEINRKGITIAAVPGGEANVEFAVIDKGDANSNWFAWSAGQVTANTIETIPYDVAVVRLSATTAEAVFEIRV